MSARFIVSDVFDGLASLEDESVDLIVTSPPFLALRSYLPADHPDKSKEIGSEATPAEFLDTLLAVTAELRRVLAPHGSIAVELGDTYAGSGGAGGDYDAEGWREGQQRFRQSHPRGSGDGHDRHDPNRPSSQSQAGLLPLNGGPGWPLAKSKTLIPQLYEIALAYGINPLTGQPSPAGRWWVRNVVTWARPNPPVGALGDKWRPATSDVVVACVSDKRYWDDLATRKPLSEQTGARQRVNDKRSSLDYPGDPKRIGSYHPDMSPSGAPLLDYWEIPLLDEEEPKPYGPKQPRPETERPKHNRTTEGREGFWDAGEGRFGVHGAGAPLLDYWEIPPGGYKGSHYAVFPEALVVPLVKAMCPENVCRECGEPSRRIVGEPTYIDRRGVSRPAEELPPGRGTIAGKQLLRGERDGNASWSETRQQETLGWSDCGHDDYRPGIVLDPFAGSGTTLAVATGHGHDAIGIDLDERNAELAMERVGPFLMEIA